MEEGKGKHVARISVTPSCFHPSFIMELSVPDDQDEEEYIDSLLDSILQTDLRYNCEWDFV